MSCSQSVAMVALSQTVAFLDNSNLCFSGVPAVYMMVVVPIGFLVGVEDIPGHTHYLFYDGDQLQAYVHVQL